ncbi:SRPBCC family protein [Nocardia sp. NPDC060249]|uniref:SRPBCC family protein n=1 Tax=Nocardia sp. NPDC060249 TaxID=3347082 RepID=UPI003661A378
MGHIRFASDVGAPVDAAFAYAEDFRHAPQWLFGVTDVAPLGEPDQGLGAAFAVKVRLFGVIPLRSSVEITEYRRNAVIGYTLRGRVYGTVTLRFDPLGYERSVLTSEADYPPPRGMFGRLCHGLVDAAAKSALRRTESRLRREIEAFHGTDLVGRIA